MSQEPYWWFQGASVQRLQDELAQAGPNAILKCLPVGKDKLHLAVVDPDGHGRDPIDDSHVCPPSCP